jgi:Tfp pilus assembly protein PilV
VAARKRRRGARGISLLEVLVATAFLSGAILAFASNSISLTRNGKTADFVGAATALAQEKLEQLRSMPLGAAQLAQGSYNDPTSLRADGTVGGPFTRSWTVSGGNQPSFGLKTVSVNVSWTDSRPHTTRVAAYVRCSVIPCP